MTDREKLIELLDRKCYDEWYGNDEIADYLLANGVIVLPCKVGDEVWIVGHKFPSEIECISITDGISFEYVEYDRSYELSEVWDDGTFGMEDIGKTVFLTREEAEAKLKEGQG